MSMIRLPLTTREQPVGPSQTPSVLSELAQLATSSSPQVLAPAWGFDIALRGDRLKSKIFRLPNLGPWTRSWLFSRQREMEVIPESAIFNASTHSTTIFRMERRPGTTEQRQSATAYNASECGEQESQSEAVYGTQSNGSTQTIPESAQAESTQRDHFPQTADSEIRTQMRATLSSHWFLCPYQSMNGITIGLAYCQVVFDKLDRATSVNAISNPVGRFAMDEATGEVFLTAFRSDGLMFVGWTQSVSTCERVREMFLFVAPPVDGQEPTHVVLRNSFYERRNCRLCGLSSTAETLGPPCKGAVSRNMASMADFSGFAQPKRRFRGNFFGVCVKRLYDRETRLLKYTEAVPILIEIRRGGQAVDQMMKRRLRESVFPGSLGPRSQNRLIPVRLGSFLDGRSMSPPSLVPTRNVLPWHFEEESAAYEHLKSKAPQSARSPAAPSKRPRTNGRASVGISKSSDSALSSKVAVPNGAPPHHEKTSSDRLSLEPLDPVMNVKRRRNRDVVDDDSVLAARRRRNRDSAARANAARKKQLEANAAELEHLKVKVVPKLKAKEASLLDENACLRQLLEDAPLDSPRSEYLEGTEIDSALLFGESTATASTADLGEFLEVGL